MSTAVNIDIRFAASAPSGVGCGIGLRGQMTSANNEYISAVQNVGTSAEVIDYGDATSTSLLVLYNSDTANPVTLYEDGSGGSHPIGVLKPGDFAVLYTTKTIGAKATTAAVAVEKLAVRGLAPTSGSLAVYVPELPAAGYATASVNIGGTSGGTTWAMSLSITKAVTGAGAVSQSEFSDSTPTDLCPITALAGGTNVGTVMLVNLSVDEALIVQHKGSSTAFGSLAPNYGFCLLPVNGASQVVDGYGDGSTVNAAAVMTQTTP